MEAKSQIDQWVQPGALVPISAEVTRALVKEVRSLRASASKTAKDEPSVITLLDELYSARDRIVALKKINKRLRKSSKPATATLLTDEQIDAIARSMPGGLDGFLKGWGWNQFAHAIIRATGAQA